MTDENSTMKPRLPDDYGTPIHQNSDKIADIMAMVEALPDYLDTSDADATADFLTKDKTAYVNGQKITGTLVPLDTSDATAEAANILLDKTAYVNGEKVTGKLHGDKVRFYDGDGHHVDAAAAASIDVTASSPTTANYILSVQGSLLGNASPSDVRKGKTFSSVSARTGDIVGIAQEGTLSVPDLSGVTATSKYVAKGYSFVDKDGAAVNGNLDTTMIRFEAPNGSTVLEGCSVSYKYPSDSSSDSIVSIYGRNLLGTADAGHVLSGKTFSSNGVDDNPSFGVEGIMPNNGAVAATINPLSTESVSIAKGYHDGNGTVSLSSELKTKLNEIDGGTGTNVAGAVSNLDTSVNTTQANLINQILAALELKTGGSEVETCTVNVSANWLAAASSLSVMAFVMQDDGISSVLASGSGSDSIVPLISEPSTGIDTTTGIVHLDNVCCNSALIIELNNYSAGIDTPNEFTIAGNAIRLNDTRLLSGTAHPYAIYIFSLTKCAGETVDISITGS